MKTKLILITLCMMASIASFGQCPKAHREFGGLSNKFVHIRNIVDMSSLVKIDKQGEYLKDKNNVYFNHIRDVGSARSVIMETCYLIEDADLETFEAMEISRFSRDKNHVYYFGFLIEGADPKTFIPLNSVYSRDENHVFFENCQIEGVDLPTLHVYYNFAYDKNFIYFYYEKTEIDFDTFVVDLDYHICKDKKYIYSFERSYEHGYEIGHIQKEEIKNSENELKN
jgi:hypothetical protein